MSCEYIACFSHVHKGYSHGPFVLSGAVVDSNRRTNFELMFEAVRETRKYENFRKHTNERQLSSLLMVVDKLTFLIDLSLLVTQFLMS